MLGFFDAKKPYFIAETNRDFLRRQGILRQTPCTGQFW